MKLMKFIKNMLNTNKHKQIMLKVLKDIYDDHILAQVLGFKGGTMAYLFYELPRFSVDLDFDLLDESKEDYVNQKVRSIIEKYGVLKQDDDKRYSIFFMFSYGEGEHNIKIDINKRVYGSKYEVKSLLGVSMLLMRQEDMVVHKMVAMYERMEEASRDIFDVHYFLSKGFPYNENILKERTSLDVATFVSKSKESLLKIKPNQLLGGLGELVDDKQKFWIKNKMLQDTIFQLDLLLI